MSVERTMLAYQLKNRGRALGRGVTKPTKGALAAILKSDGEEVPTCVYNEFVAHGLAMLLHLPVAHGVLVDGGGTYQYASLIAASGGVRLPDLERTRAPKAAARYPRECAGLFVFDVFIGNWDRAGNVKASLSTAIDFFCGFDHSHSLLFAARHPATSVAMLEAGEALVGHHLFEGVLDATETGHWVSKIGALSDKQITECCCPGADVNAVSVATQQALAAALMVRRNCLADIVASISRASGGGA